MAMLVRNEVGNCGPARHLSYMGDMIGKPVLNVVPALFASGQDIKVTAGMAILSGAVPLPQNLREGNAETPFEEMTHNMVTCFIGHFPMAERWRSEGRPVHIVELRPGEGDIHWNDSREVLSRAELVFITGLTLINGTFEEVIRRTPQAKQRVLMGPTVPPSEVFLDYGIDLVGSTVVCDEKAAVRYYQHGGAGIKDAPAGALKTVNISRR